MRTDLHCSAISLAFSMSQEVFRILVVFVVAGLFQSALPSLQAQVPNRVTQEVDVTKVRALPNHVPGWANSANAIGPVPSDQMLERLKLVLSRSPQQQEALESLLAEQQNPESPDYHRWLTPAEVGDQFGVSAQDISRVTEWLQSHGLRVDRVYESRTMIAFSGKAADVARAFQTELQYYNVEGKQHFSVTSDPMIPAALAPVIKAIRGLHTIEEHPLSHFSTQQSVSPSYTLSAGSSYVVAPGDFAKIYDLPSNLTGTGITIGIVGRSRTDFADFSNFRSLTGSTFPNPTEVVPTAYGGVDPGPACTASPCANGDQGEATLDVLRAGSIAPAAKLLLVVDTVAGGDIGADAEYLVDTTPVPAQVMNLSFGACESAAGASGVAFWDNLFQAAAAEGISVLVASGDSGASGCDAYNAAPPASPLPNSPNYICSSSYATCVGGTEFNDASSYSTYWSSANGAGLGSALSYIPEGGWNEPLTSTNTTRASSSGGGVSAYIATPPWQTGTGVPTARTGRYTPDISFTASGHDGYFSCFAAGGGSCVVTNGSYFFEIFAGTSASAPSMAGITALLDQKEGNAQGNLNPRLYQLAASTPAAFHDVTVATSGVASCSVATPSICNNSIPGPAGLTGGQAGYLVTAGYDEVTGLGSLDVTNFVNSWPITAPQAATPAFTPAPGPYTSTQTVTITDGTTGAAIHYTTNGTTPTSTSTLYSAPLTVNATTTIEAIAVASGYSNSAVASATYTISAAKTPQTIAFGAAPALTVGGTGTLNATASSGLAVTFTSTTTSICTVSGSTVTGVAAGSCVVAANQAGNATYAAAPQVTQTIAVGKVSQAITFGTAPAVTVGGTGTLSATASSGLGVTFTSMTTSVCTVSGSAVTGVAAGSCVVAANQAGSATYNAAPQVTQTITVGKGSQTITFGVAPSVVVGGAGTVSAKASSGLAVTFASTTTTICTVNGSTVTGVAAGTCIITANQAGNANYNAAAQVTQNITVAAGNFTLSASPGSLTICRLPTYTTTISTGVSGAFNSPIQLYVSGVPSGITATFSPTSVAAPGSGTAKLSITASTATIVGVTDTLTVTAIGGGITHSVPVTILVSGCNRRM